MEKNIEVIITKDQLSKKVAQLGERISEDYRGRIPILVCVLKGAFVFLADLVRSITIPIEVDFMTVSSYDRTSSSGIVRIIGDLSDSIEGREVLIVEDIIDSGLTLSFLRENLLVRRPSNLKVCALLVKEIPREKEIGINYIGFEIPGDFVVGYGLDYGGRYRNLSYVGVLSDDVIDGGSD